MPIATTVRSMFFRLVSFFSDESSLTQFPDTLNKRKVSKKVEECTLRGLNVRALRDLRRKGLALAL